MGAPSVSGVRYLTHSTDDEKRLTFSENITHLSTRTSTVLHTGDRAGCAVHALVSTYYKHTDIKSNRPTQAQHTQPAQAMCEPRRGRTRGSSDRYTQASRWHRRTTAVTPNTQRATAAPDCRQSMHARIIVRTHGSPLGAWWRRPGRPRQKCTRSAARWRLETGGRWHTQS